MIKILITILKILTMNQILKNIKKLWTTLPGLMLAIPAIIYGIKSGDYSEGFFNGLFSGDWNEAVIGAIVSGVGLIISPNYMSKEEREVIKKQFKDSIKKRKDIDNSNYIKKNGLMIALLLVSFFGYTQNNTTSKVVRASELRGLTTGYKVDGNPADSTINLIYELSGANKSAIYVNDTLLTDWLSVHGGGGGSSDSSWTSIEVDTINSFSTSDLRIQTTNDTYINGLSGGVYIEDIRFLDASIASTVGDVTITDNVKPSPTGVYSLGTSSLQWRDIYTSGTIQNSSGGVGIENVSVTSSAISGVSVLNTAGGSITTNATFLPSGNNIRDLGIDNTGEWRTGYFATDIEVRDSTLIEIIEAHSSGGTPGGSSTQLQYNNAGSFGGMAGFVYDGTNLIGSAGYLQHDDIRIDGAQINSPSSGTVQINDAASVSGNFTPTIDDTYDLGNSTNRFNDLWVRQVTGGSFALNLSSNSSISINPGGTSNVDIGNYTLDGDQTVGAGQDNYVLTYDNSSGLVSLESNSGSYTPTITGTTNCASNCTNTTAGNFFWTRNGNIVSVTGTFVESITKTSEANETAFTLTVPIATGNFTTNSDANGAGSVDYPSDIKSAIINSNTGAQTVLYTYFGINAEGSGNHTVIFSYEIQ